MPIPGGDEPRAALDPQVSTPGREGLTGTTASDRYSAPEPGDQITIAPDWRPASEQPAWRRDFPIDWPQDQYVARRDFMKFLVLTSFAFTVGQFWIAGQNWWRSRRGLPPIARVAGLADVPVGGATTFAYPRAGDPCVLVRTAEQQFVAYSQKCTHLSCAVRPLAEQGVLECPCHRGVFDLANGRVLAGPPRRPLPRITLEVRGDAVYATGVEKRSA